MNFRPLLLALLLACEVICGLFFFQNVKDFRPLFLVLACEVICELFFFQNSRISDHISVGDSFTVLLDDSLKEYQSLREQLR